MSIEKSRKVELLRKVHLFKDLPEERIQSLAEELEEFSFPNGQTIFKQNTPAEMFYILLEGKVELTRSRVREEIVVTRLVPGDYMGSEAALAVSRRYATATARADSIVLGMTREQVTALAGSSPHFRSSLKAIYNSRQLSQTLNFKWLEPDEVIYLLARKHPIVLYESLLGPIFSAMVPATLMYLAVVTNSMLPAMLAGGLTVLILLWILWNWLDWGNDYYVVTNRRVVWLEKVIALYDSRQEAPLTTILPVAVETDIIGRVLDYGDVIVRTYTGRIMFRHVPQPYQIAAMVEEYRARALDVSRRQEMEAMKQTLRVKLGITPPRPVTPPPPPAKPKQEKVSIPQVLITNLFRLRTVQGGTVTFQKHWFILIRQTWKPALLVLIMLLIISANLAVNTGDSQGTIFLILLTLASIFFLWFVYEFVDWRNDRFQLTPEQILDIDKKPLGLEQRKSAKLEDILSIEYKRIGLLGILFNFGTVFIMVGNTQFTFDEVPDPASVQQEIEQRRNARILGKREMENAAERDRIAEWLVTYHRSTGELNDLEERYRSRQNPE